MKISYTGNCTSLNFKSSEGAETSQRPDSYGSKIFPVCIWANKLGGGGKFGSDHSPSFFIQVM